VGGQRTEPRINERPRNVPYIPDSIDDLDLESGVVRHAEPMHAEPVRSEPMHTAPIEEARAAAASSAWWRSRRSRMAVTAGTSSLARLNERNIQTTASSSSGVRSRPRTP